MQNMHFCTNDGAVCWINKVKCTMVCNTFGLLVGKGHMYTGHISDRQECQINKGHTYTGHISDTQECQINKGCTYVHRPY